MIKTVNIPELESDYNNKLVDVHYEDFNVTLNGKTVPCFKSSVSKIPFNKRFDGLQGDINQTEIIGYACV